MKRLYYLLFVMLAATGLQAQPTLVPTTFLDAGPPDKMDREYVRKVMGPDHMGLVQPSGGALLKIDRTYDYLCLYIFCDAPANRLMIFSLSDDHFTRRPIGVKEYGLMAPPTEITFFDTIAHPVVLPPPYDTIGYVGRPVDVVTSAVGRFFDPDSDFVFVADQENHKIIKLRYDQSLDSLVWVSSFGKDILRFPTSLDYADYGESDRNLHDIFVTDAFKYALLRFSAEGRYEDLFGYWGDGLTQLGFPTGVAVSSKPSLAHEIYVTDSKFHRVMRYYSETNGQIIVDGQFIFPLTSPVPLLNAIDTDISGNVYVVNSFAHNITILTPGLDSIRDKYGEEGFNPGQFYFPADIYIDGDQVQISERWEDSSGIQSFVITEGQPKEASEIMPRRFSLHQNYPNPFNSQTTIKFDLPVKGEAELVIYNILGQKVVTLIKDPIGAGSHSVIWDGRNSAGEAVSSGIYFAVLRVGWQRDFKKLLLLK